MSNIGTTGASLEPTAHMYKCRPSRTTGNIKCRVCLGKLWSSNGALRQTAVKAADKCICSPVQAAQDGTQGRHRWHGEPLWWPPWVRPHDPSPPSEAAAYTPSPRCALSERSPAVRMYDRREAGTGNHSQAMRLFRLMTVWRKHAVSACLPQCRSQTRPLANSLTHET